MAEALRLSSRLDHAVYDCIYLALAQAEDAVLVTADDRFAAKVEAASLGLRLRRLKAWRGAPAADQP